MARSCIINIFPVTASLFNTNDSKPEALSSTMNKDNTRYMFTVFSLTENQLVCFSWNRQSSPAADELGIVFVFSNDTNIHNCLMLPSVATVAGMWGDRDTLLSSPCQVCRKEGFYVVVRMYINEYVFMLMHCQGRLI